MQTDISFIDVLFISCSVLVSGFEDLKYDNNNLNIMYWIIWMLIKIKYSNWRFLFAVFFILSSQYIENKTLMIVNISNHDRIKNTSNTNGCLQIAIATHNYLQISNTKCKKHIKVKGWKKLYLLACDGYNWQGLVFNDPRLFITRYSQTCFSDHLY
jgi:hypothetical protein